MHKTDELANFVEKFGLNKLLEKSLTEISKELNVSIVTIQRFVKVRYKITFKALRRRYILEKYNKLKEEGLNDEAISQELNFKNSKEMNRVISFYQKTPIDTGKLKKRRSDKQLGKCCTSCGVYFVEANLIRVVCKSCKKLYPNLPVSRYKEL